MELSEDEGEICVESTFHLHEQLDSTATEFAMPMEPVALFPNGQLVVLQNQDSGYVRLAEGDSIDEKFCGTFQPEMLDSEVLIISVDALSYASLKIDK